MFGETVMYDKLFVSQSLQSFSSNLKVQSCKLYNKKYNMIALTQITNSEIFAFIAVLVLSYWTVKIYLPTWKAIETFQM